MHSFKANYSVLAKGGNARERGFERRRRGTGGAGRGAVKQLNRDRPPVTGIQNWRGVFGAAGGGRFAENAGVTAERVAKF